MKIINATTASNNLYQLIADVNAESNPIIITNNKGKNAVLISEEDWNALQETIYLNSVPCLAKSIIVEDEPIEQREVYDPNEEW